MKILIITHSEICYNPRLLKAADFFCDKGVEVTIFNPIRGIATKKLYDSTLKGKKWIIQKNDISKKNISSFLRWLIISGIHAFILFLYKKKIIAFNDTILNKGLILHNIKSKVKYDFILINLVDNLPFASKLKNKMGSNLIFDSQEYFTGQYKNLEKYKYEWVCRAQQKHMSDVDILIATTNVMREKIVQDYSLIIPSFRVRNVPSLLMLENLKITDHINITKYLVWHGFPIRLNNERGVHILVKALGKCKENVKLVLQGFISDDEKQILNDYILKYNLQDKIILQHPAHPYKIVQSLCNYDIGLIGELAEDNNQMLTSSNKLFDYINAGLAVIAPDLAGLNETVKDLNLGLNYKSGDEEGLARAINELIDDEVLLKDCKKRSKEISKKELFWENDFEPVWKCVQKKFEITKN